MAEEELESLLAATYRPLCSEQVQIKPAFWDGVQQAQAVDAADAQAAGARAGMSPGHGGVGNSMSQLPSITPVQPFSAAAPQTPRVDVERLQPRGAAITETPARSSGVDMKTESQEMEQQQLEFGVAREVSDGESEPPSTPRLGRAEEEKGQNIHISTVPLDVPDTSSQRAHQTQREARAGVAAVGEIFAIQLEKEVVQAQMAQQHEDEEYVAAERGQHEAQQHEQQVSEVDDEKSGEGGDPQQNLDLTDFGERGQETDGEEGKLRSGECKNWAEQFGEGYGSWEGNFLHQHDVEEQKMSSTVKELDPQSSDPFHIEGAPGEGQGEVPGQDDIYRENPRLARMDEMLEGDEEGLYLEEVQQGLFEEAAEQEQNDCQATSSFAGHGQHMVAERAPTADILDALPRIEAPITTFASLEPSHTRLVQVMLSNRLIL